MNWEKSSVNNEDDQDQVVESIYQGMNIGPNQF